MSHFFGCVNSIHSSRMGSQKHLEILDKQTLVFSIRSYVRKYNVHIRMKQSILRKNFRVLSYLFWSFVTHHREPQLGSENGSHIICVFTRFFHFCVCLGTGRPSTRYNQTREKKKVVETYETPFSVSLISKSKAMTFSFNSDIYRCKKM